VSVDNFSLNKDSGGGALCRDSGLEAPTS